MKPSSVFNSILEQEEISEKDLRTILKEIRLLLPEDSKYYKKNVRLPRNNKILFVLFSVYKLYSMLQIDYFRTKLEHKTYVSEDVIKSNIGNLRYKRRYELVFFSKSLFNDCFGVKSKDYLPYVELLCQPFRDYEYKKKCKLYEWKDLAQLIFPPLIQAWREGKFEFKEEYLDIMNNIPQKVENNITPELNRFVITLKSLKPLVPANDLLQSEFNQFKLSHYHIKNNAPIYDKLIELRRENRA